MRMSDVKKVVLGLAALFALSLTAPAVKADAIIIGDRVGTGAGNTSPFGISAVSYAAGGRYQQIYASSAFPNRPLTVTQIAFASAFRPGGPGIAAYNFTVRLSTTAATTSAPSTIFNGNLGADFRTVFSGPLTADITQTGAVFDLVITLDTPFIYDPSNGNLLLDVIINSPTMFTAGELGFVCGCQLDNVGPSNVARIFNERDSIVGFTDAQPVGLLTRFTVNAPVPEPATSLLLVTGLAGVGAAVRKRHQSRANRRS